MEPSWRGGTLDVSPTSAAPVAPAPNHWALRTWCGCDTVYPRLFAMTPIFYLLLCLPHPQTQQAVGESAKKALTSCYLVPVKTGGGKRGLPSTPPLPPITLISLWGRGWQQHSPLNLPWGVSGTFQRNRQSVGVAAPQGGSRTFQSPEEVGLVWGSGKGRRSEPGHPFSESDLLRRALPPPPGSRLFPSPPRSL